jgi:hypothetical protein
MSFAIFFIFNLKYGRKQTSKKQINKESKQWGYFWTNMKTPGLPNTFGEWSQKYPPWTYSQLGRYNYNIRQITNSQKRQFNPKIKIQFSLLLHYLLTPEK